MSLSSFIQVPRSRSKEIRSRADGLRPPRTQWISVAAATRILATAAAFAYGCSGFFAAQFLWPSR
jgi:hypothetical protein